jgi:hypothetical protein
VAAQSERLDWRAQPRRAAEYLKLDAQGYKQIAHEALELTITREYQMLHVAVTGRLSYFPRIGTEMIEHLERLARELREWS